MAQSMPEQSVDSIQVIFLKSRLQRGRLDSSNVMGNKIIILGNEWKLCCWCGNFRFSSKTEWKWCDQTGKIKS